MRALTKKTLKICLMTAVIVSASAAHTSAWAESPDDILVIANKAVKAGSLSAADVRRLFLKESDRAGGAQVIVINSKNAALRDAFRAKALKMSASEEEKYWQDQKVRSGLSKPSAFANSIKAVFSVKKGIGYCFRKDYKDGLAKVVLAL